MTPADWYDTIKNRMNISGRTISIPEIPGTYVYARMVRRAVQAPARSPSPDPDPLRTGARSDPAGPAGAAGAAGWAGAERR